MKRKEILNLIFEIAKAAEQLNIKKLEIEFQDDPEWLPTRIKKINYERI